MALPSFHVTGPVHHFVAFAGDAQATYLGTAEVTPKVEHRIMQADTFNDLGGSMVPMQRTEQGEMAVIGTLLNRYNKDAMYLLQELSVQPVVAGERGPFSRGGLVFGPSSFELWLLFTNATNAAFRTPGLEMGYYFPQVCLTGMTRDRLGTDTEKLLLVCEAYPYWVPSGTYAGDWQLYANDDASVLAPGVSI